MIDNSQKRKNRLDFLALVSWLLISLGLATISYMWGGTDFRGYYAAARVFITGGNPYDYHQVAQVLLSVTGRMGNNPYYYAPWFVWLFIPLTLLPFQIARAVWMLLNLLAWNFSLWKISRIINWPQKGWRQYLFFILSTFTFAWITWIFEQASILVFAILVALLFSIRNQKWGLSGLLLSFLLIKPNITLVVVATICLWLISNEQWKPIKAFGSWLVILLTITTLLTPTWYRPFFEPGFGQGLSIDLDGPNKLGATRFFTTIFDWLAILGIKDTLSWFTYGICAILGFILLYWIVRHSKSLMEVTSVALLVSYFLTPYALQYDYAPLVIVLLWALSLCTSSKKARVVGYLFAGFIFSVTIWKQNIAWGFWIVIGLIALLAWGLYQTP